MKIKRHAVILTLLVLATVSTTPAAKANASQADKEQKYIAVLKSNAPTFEKARACQELAVIGSKKAVPVLAELLEDKILSDYARFALEPVKDPAVDEVFRNALTRLKGAQLAGVINSIGARRDAKAVTALSNLAREPASQVAEEAIAALGRIATEQATEIILQILKTGPENLRPPAADASLAAAEQQMTKDKTKEAARIYDAVRNAQVPPHFRAAGIYGAILARGDDGLPLLLEQLNTNDPLKVEIALRAARQLPGPEVTKALAAELETARPILQALLLNVLADRNDPAAFDSIKSLASSRSPEVRIASLKVLGRIGDASAVPPLLKALAAKGEEAAIAAASLTTLEGRGVDQSIIEGMRAAKLSIRPELISILADRNCTAATPALLKEAAAKNQAIATAAFKALTSLAAPKYLPALVDLLADLKATKPRTAAENAVVAVAQKARTTEPIIAKLNATKQIDSRISLLKVLGRIADEGAFEALNSALEDKNAKIRDTAVRALAAWPDSRAIKTLSTISQNTSNNTHRVLALRGYVRLLALDTELPQDEKVEMYRIAVKTAAGANEKKLVLAGLANLAHLEALTIILGYIDEPAVKDEAILAALKVAPAIAGARPWSAEAAAARIMRATSNQQLRNQAQTLLKTVDGFNDFIMAWRVSGPYLKGNRNFNQLFDTAFPPEEKDVDINWSLMPAATDAERPWILDLLKLYSGNSRVAYLKTWIKSDKRKEAVLELGSDDGIKAWLNGKLIHAKNAARAAIPASDEAKVTLNKGWNKLMLKITQNIGPWEFCARIAEADGGPVEGIEVDCLHEESETAAAKRAVTIFDGKTFTGWEGNIDFFRIEDGAIVGGNLKNRIPRNEFLCTEKEYDNFELRLKVKLLGDPAKANAGIQIRSRRIPNHNEMIGYQADMGQHYWGCLYDESRRRKVLASANRAELDKVLNVGEWNDYVIRCEGKRIRLWINGCQTIDYTEPDDTIEQTGLIGLQIHSGPPSEAWYKEIKIKEL
ncbi:MAG: family 16 glycoside hydrolase [Planctomycetota bacterium]|jgi:HEAT repeat protein